MFTVPDGVNPATVCGPSLTEVVQLVIDSNAANANPTIIRRCGIFRQFAPAFVGRMTFDTIVILVCSRMLAGLQRDPLRPLPNRRAAAARSYHGGGTTR